MPPGTLAASGMSSSTSLSLRFVFSWTRMANEKFWEKHFKKMSAGQEKLALFRLQPTMDDQFHLKPRFNDDYNKQKEAEATKPRSGGLDAFLKAYEGK